MTRHQYQWTRNPWPARIYLALKSRGHTKSSRLVGYALGIDAYGELPRSLALPHPYGIVISAQVTFGENCVVYQGVTIGVDDEGGAPTIEDRVEIYPGACLFGDITIGAGARIGANAVVLKDVPAGATAVGVPARSILADG